MSHVDLTSIPIRYSSRAKRMSIKVESDGGWEVIIPQKSKLSRTAIHRFVEQHEEWISTQIARAKQRKPKQSLIHQGISRIQIEKQTRKVVDTHIAYFCQERFFSINKVTVRNYKAQWGSCSKQFHLTFHYKLSLLPESLSRYVVAHELCHTVHFNHSKSFWEFLETMYPGSKRHRKELRQFGL